MSCGCGWVWDFFGHLVNADLLPAAAGAEDPGQEKPEWALGSQPNIADQSQKTHGYLLYLSGVGRKGFPIIRLPNVKVESFAGEAGCRTQVAHGECPVPSAEGGWGHGLRQSRG